MLMLAMSVAMYAQTDFSTYPVYEGDDLGAVYAPDKTVLRVWSPRAESITVRLYDAGLGGTPYQVHQMKPDVQGTWLLTLSGDLDGKFYTIQVRQGGRDYREVPDPYARFVGANGRRAMIGNWEKTTPERLAKSPVKSEFRQTDAILYELHVRDFSVAANSGMTQIGKYLAFTERGTKNPDGLPTGLDHIKQLGVTHIHLLPTYDYYTVDETKPDSAQYNWGYDPLNYNTVEGGYSTNPADGFTRVREFREMVQAIHGAGMGVVLDMVYNHTMFGEESHLNQTVPGYYYRFAKDGSWSNASACGNETASDRPMFRRYMLHSLKMWLQDYQVDGFRFDLMAIHDIETMNYLSAELHKINPAVVMYGEGWTAGDSPLPVEKRALKQNAYQLDRVAAFSDDLRDGTKGSVFDHHDGGFATGKKGMTESVKFGIVAATKHPQVDYSKVNYSKAPWAKEPYHCINYVSCHDNHTLWDRIQNSNPKDSEADRIKMHLLAESIVLTSQGTPFLLSGTEMLRTKQNVENSYNSPDHINEIDWSRKTRYLKEFDYFRGLIALRRQHPAFRMPTTEQIAKHLQFMPDLPEGVIAYRITGKPNGEKWKDIIVIFNANRTPYTLPVGKGKWQVVVENQQANEKGLRKFSGDSIEVSGISTTILAR